METHKAADLLAALSEKEKEIEDLKLTLRAHAVRTSNVQTRLLATLDALDTLQTSNAQDLTAASQKYNQLKKKMSKYRLIAQECESERDEMREAVNTLVEKVEASNDYALWSHARMQISGHVDPIPPSNSTSLGNNDENRLLGYAGAVIQALTLERDLEKQEHEHDLRTAKAKISMLEAQLALRECELESCISHTRECYGPQSFQELEMESTALSREDAIRLLQLAAAKNKALDMGNKRLLQRLEIFRSLVSSKVDASCQTMEVLVDIESEKETDAAGSPATIVGDINSAFEIGYRARTPVPRTSHGATSLIEDFDRDLRELGSKINAFRAEQTKLVEIIRTEKLEHPKLHDSSALDDNLVPPRDHTKLSSSPLISPREPKSSNEPDRPTYESLEQAYKASLQREKSLIEENAKLLGLLCQIEGSRADTTEGSHERPVVSESPDSQTPNTNPTFFVQLIDDGGEMTMDLGTPLLPTPIVLPTEAQSATSTSTSPSSSHLSIPQQGGSSQNTNLIDVAVDPVSRESYSPLALSPPDSGYPNFSFQNTSQEPTSSPHGREELISEVDIRQLEKELEEAQKRLMDSQSAMNDVQEALSNLDLEMQS